MIIGVPKEIKLQDHRIGLTPESVKTLTARGHEVLVQKNAGYESGFYNDDYEKSGAKILENAKEIFDKSEIIVKVKEPQLSEVNMIKEDQIIFTYLHLAAAKELTDGLIKSKSIYKENDPILNINLDLNKIKKRLHDQLPTSENEINNYLKII